ncbi:MAG TPA: hypothetical protein VMV77_03495 [Bacteroidales bacterium]|nr:hypothetical protein [Bacteroidales bacterium]
MKKKVMKLINPSTGLAECKVCGATKYISFVNKPFSSKSRYPRGSWQCVNGCNLDPETVPTIMPDGSVGERLI